MPRKARWGSSKQLEDMEGAELAIVMARAKTVPSRPHKKLPADHGIEWPRNKQWQLEREFWRKERTRGDTMTDTMEFSPDDEGVMRGLFDDELNSEAPVGVVDPMPEVSAEPRAVTASSSEADLAAKKASKEIVDATIKASSKAIGEWSRKQRELEAILAKSRLNATSSGSVLEADLQKLVTFGEATMTALRKTDVEHKAGTNVLAACDAKDSDKLCVEIFNTIKSSQKKVIALNVVFTA